MMKPSQCYRLSIQARQFQPQPHPKSFGFKLKLEIFDLSDYYFRFEVLIININKSRLTTQYWMLLFDPNNLNCKFKDI